MLINTVAANIAEQFYVSILLSDQNGGLYHKNIFYSKPWSSSLRAMWNITNDINRYTISYIISDKI